MIRHQKEQIAADIESVQSMLSQVQSDTTELSYRVAEYLGGIHALKANISRDFTPRFAVIAGPRQGEVFRLENGVLSIGRDPSNDFWVLDATVSRTHCQLEKRDDAFIIRDMGGRNGTVLNGVLLGPGETQLADGDEISIGASTFVFLQPAKHAMAAPAL